MRKALLVMALVLFGIYSFAFVDVPEDHWAYEYVMDLANRGILPMEDNFNPDVVLTKAEVAELLSDTLTYIENDPVLAKAEDIKRVETVMDLLNKKIDEVANSKADAAKVKELSEELNKVSTKLETITKVAYRAFNNADMVVEDMLDLSDTVDSLSSDLDALKGDTSRKLLEVKYMVLDLGDRVSSLEDALSKNTDDVSVNTENIDGLWEELETLQSDLDYVSGENVKAHEELKASINTVKVSVEKVEGKVAANTEKINAVEEKANSANTMAMVGIGAAVLAAVLAFVF
ncbi:hypothetical protein XO10_08535 [Marinitoga sp. 1135]|uniref:S-layer homology domain-containing protein n=1 Tax=Marinitoga sp. 1135 TaxID=1643333 RepID=UPI0015865105|nr:S-layer homology domain-containing protein [Marinitoga sp. 1135]NUU96302.1 hypothetical protein [Marinitoga sp. 1135]